MLTMFKNMSKLNTIVVSGNFINISFDKINFNNSNNLKIISMYSSNLYGNLGSNIRNLWNFSII